MVKYIWIRPPVSTYVRVDKKSGLTQNSLQQVIDFPALHSWFTDEDEELTIDNWRSKEVEVVYCSIPFGARPATDMVLTPETYTLSDESYFSLN